LRKVEVVKSSEVEIKPFILDEYIHEKEEFIQIKKVSKKVLKQLAKELDLNYDDEQLRSSKKLFEAYLAKGKI